VDLIPEAGLAGFAAANPSAYLINNAQLNLSAVHGAGLLGQGIIVAVIDSGIRPGFPHLTLDGSVIGCEDFVGDANGCSHIGNNGHGTFVAGMISANVNFTFSTASGLRNAVLTYCPACFANPPTNTQIPMIGSAPLSSIYALRVFGPTGGAPFSRILAAVDRAIDLKKKFDAGDPAGVNIQVMNMSLGGPTLNPGRSLEDMAVNAALDANILLVVSAGNEGPATLSLGSPGSALSALTVGAASDATHERIVRQLQLPSSLGPLRGQLFRPSGGTQTAVFSSRGPSANGHVDPDVVANGDWNYGQGFATPPGGISLGSGTSFSAPSVSGIAALLRQGFPNATARQIHNAIRKSANPNFLADGSINVDQGRGYADAMAAFNLLAAGSVPDKLPHGPLSTPFVSVNVELNTSLDVHRGLHVSKRLSDLKPGQRSDILYRVWPLTRRVVITLDAVTPALPPAQQNQLFGDDILLAVHTAKTSAFNDYLFFDFTTGTQIVIDDPEPGLLRISVNGDWTNAGNISADVHVTAELEPIERISKLGKIKNGETQSFTINVPPGTAQADFQLDWILNWENYPVNDLDMILMAPNGTLNFAGASFDSPERASVANPLAGTWTIFVDGFEVNSKADVFKLRANLDGKIIKIK
jgi:subtilisin family serine protease